MSAEFRHFDPAFFEEASELLEDMETLILALDTGVLKPEQLNAIFRGAHSIKGAAATFGCSDVVEFAHGLECVLDKLRNGELQAHKQLLDVMLLVCDATKARLAVYCGRGPVNADVISAASATLNRVLNSPVAPANLDEVVDGGPAAGASKVMRIEFSTTDITRETLDDIFISLARHGVLENLSLNSPQHARGKAEKCVLRLTTDVTASDLWADLVFCVDPEHLKIENVTPTAHVRRTQRRATDRAEPGWVKAGRRENDRLIATASEDTTTIRVNVEKLDRLSALVDELTASHLLMATALRECEPVTMSELAEGMTRTERNIRDIQTQLKTMRMMAVSQMFKRFPRMVRDVSAQLKKRVELRTAGAEIELDREVIEKIIDPVTHLIRNSLAHGIEQPDIRRAAGKNATGTITLRAFHEQSDIVIEVADDGVGLNREKIIAQARSQGILLSPGVTDRDVWALICAAGLSTAETVTDVSGRGVGMDVVQRNVAALGGRLDIDSQPGQGTQIAIRLPRPSAGGLVGERAARPASSHHVYQ